VAAFCTQLRLLPYDVPKGRGELKHVLVTVSPDGELMLRFVLRSAKLLGGRTSAAAAAAGCR
jgi:23S rRNA (uracil747-C5)-methyltransferase